MPAVTERELRVDGLRELQRSFAVADKETAKGLRETLREMGEPVRSLAEDLAGSEIRNLHPEDRWTLMRTVVTPSRVYVAPVERGRRTRTRPQIARPNLADLLMDRAMLPALEANYDRIEREVGEMLDDVGSKWERV